MPIDPEQLGQVWIIKGADLMAMLKQVAAGDLPGVVYAEHYASSEIDHYWDGDDG